MLGREDALPKTLCFRCFILFCIYNDDIVVNVISLVPVDCDSAPRGAPWTLWRRLAGTTLFVWASAVFFVFTEPNGAPLRSPVPRPSL